MGGEASLRNDKERLMAGSLLHDLLRALLRASPSSVA
jgi:hypothetical protein